MEITRDQYIEQLSKLYWISPQLEAFLKGVKATYYAYNEITQELTIDEVWIEGVQFLITVQTNSSYKRLVYFRDDIVMPELAYEQLELPIEYLEPKLNALKEAIVRQGCELINSGMGGNDQYLWHDLAMPIDGFTVKQLVICASMWYNYNKSAHELIERQRHHLKKIQY